MLRALIGLSLLLPAAAPSAAQDWPQWRGPSRDGRVPASSAPEAWPERFARRWRVEVGEGYSSPVVASGRVFVHGRRDPEEIVTAVDLETGRVLWQHTYTAAFQKNQYAVNMAKGPNATPLVIGSRLFTLGVTGVLTAWDTASGRVLWRQDHSTTVDTSKLFCGTAASPMALGGGVLVQLGSDIHGGRLRLLDPSTGTARWEWKGPGPGYASPIVIDVDGVSQVVTMTEGSIVGVDPATGRELWTAPFPDEWHENIITPLWTGTHLVMSGPRQATHAYTLRRDGDRWHATEAWKNGDVAMYMSSPVFHDGVIYGHSSRRKGQFVALDAATGAVKWSTEGREGEHASVLVTPRHLLFLTNGADLIVARPDGAALAVERRYADLSDAQTWAVPILLGRDLLVRDATALNRLAPSP